MIRYTCFRANSALWSEDWITGRQRNVTYSTLPRHTFPCKVTCYSRPCFYGLESQKSRESNSCREDSFYVHAVLMTITFSLFFFVLKNVFHPKRYDWVHNLSKIPTSKKGYTLGARTAMRFKSNKVRNGCMHFNFRVIHGVVCICIGEHRAVSGRLPKQYALKLKKYRHLGKSY